MTRPLRDRRWPAALALGLASFLVYNANFREISASDTVGTRLTAVAIVLEQRLFLDRFFRGYPTDRRLPNWMQYVRGHYVSATPLFPALLAVPVYLLPVRLLWVDPPLINLLSKVNGSLFAALSVAFVYLALRHLAPKSVAVVIALVYAFATSTWSVSSQGLWGHGPAQLFLAIALYCLLRGEAHPRALEWAGLAAGCMFASRPQTTGVIGAAVVACALSRDRRRGIRCLLWFAAAAGGVLAYNAWMFGSLQGGYYRLNETYLPIYGVQGVWTASVGTGLLGLLVSPSRGLLIYSPVLVFAFVGAARSIRDPRRRMLGLLAAGFGGSLLMLGGYAFWWGGHTYGPRLTADFLPILTLFVAVAWQGIEGSRVRIAVFCVLTAVSIAIQAIGAFYYPSPPHLDWDKTPVDVDLAHDRLWDWRDTQIGRLLRNGPHPLGFGGWPSFVGPSPRGAPAPGSGR